MADGIERKLTTILAADVEGYSRLMEADEAGALVALRQSRAVFARLIERHRGRIANTAGDGLNADFPSVVEAVPCAAAAIRLGSGRAACVVMPACCPLGEVATMTLRYAVGIKIRQQTDQMTIDAEDALIAALKVKIAHPEAAITYVRKQNTRGDRRHPHGADAREHQAGSAAAAAPGTKPAGTG